MSEYLSRFTRDISGHTSDIDKIPTELRKVEVSWKRGVSFPKRFAGVANPRAARLQSIARRTVIGSVITMTASGINTIFLTVWDGQSAWLCLTLCKLDGMSLVAHRPPHSDNYWNDVGRSCGFFHLRNKPMRTDHQPCSVRMRSGAILGCEKREIWPRLSTCLSKKALVTSTMSQ